MDEIAKSLYQAFIAEKIQLLKSIAREYDIDENELLRKYSDQHNNGSNSNALTKKSSSKKKKNDFIETEEYTYNGIVYLIDAKDQVYTYNIEKPMLIGDKLLDGSIKFSKEYMNMMSGDTSG